MRGVRIVSALIVLGSAASAFAQGRSSSALEDDNYFGIKLMLGVAGSASVSDVSGSVNVPGIGSVGGGASGVSTSDNMQATFGGGLQYMVALHRYFVLGGLFAAQSWQDDAGNRANTSRNLLLDLAIVPEARLPIANTVELYLAVPLGLSMDFWKGGSTVINTTGLNVQSSDTALGFTLSVLFGARFALTRSVGLFGEIGYVMHTFSHDVRGNVLGVAFDASAHLTLEQLGLNVGVFF